MKTIRKPHEKHACLTKQSDLPDSVFAFSKQLKPIVHITAWLFAAFHIDLVCARSYFLVTG